MIGLEIINKTFSFWCLIRVPSMATLSTVETCKIQLTLECSWVGHGLQTGHRLAFSLWQSDFKTKKDQFWISHQKNGVVFLKSQIIELVRPKMVFLVILAKIRLFSDNSNAQANLNLTYNCRSSSCLQVQRNS